ncbi:MAG: hypothetical protein JWL65_6862 [Gammaproteobacteria bacterium]|nr:hypothetical protein [Gammaproteobacteria bacterium]
MKSVAASLLTLLLVACSASAICDRGTIAGLFSKRVGTETIVLNLSSDGTGALSFNKEVRHSVTWEFESEGPQVLISGEAEVLERLRRLANLEPPPPGVVATRRMTVLLGCVCNWQGRATQLLVDIEGSFALARQR